ncbi:unnamed protein product [Adineta steineri]|uniref:MAM domain-containing protein n=1 Tax=Adineta steineri TaxID=433720 RepID=A0A819D337_9BILA|nr:unnamed protein product [Adineta steineri]CAF3827882.1 unnamed protein product [Adineta steineri]
MKYMIGVLFFVYSCLVIAYAQILYQCNFDNNTLANLCLKPEQLAGLLISEQLGSADIQPPISPLSDVTSSLKPTSNGQSCNLPYQLNAYTWDMYFCNDGYCQTTTDSTSKCSSGKFGYFNFQAPRKASFRLNTDLGGTNGTDDQCLTYYYYLSNITGTAQSITVRKQEAGDISETIDIVISSPYNGWIKRQVSFYTSKGGYKVYFDFEKTSGPNILTTIIAIDEISVHQGNCPSEPTTQSTPTISVGTITSITTMTEPDMTTSNITETISAVQTIDTTLTESSSMEPITTATTTTTATATSTTTTTTITTTATLTITITTSSSTTTTTTLTTSTTITSTTTTTTVSTTTTATSTSTTTSTATTTTTSTTNVITITTTATTASTTISTSTITSTPTTIITTTTTTTSTSIQTTTTTSTTSTSSTAKTTTITMLTTTTTVTTNQPSPTTMIVSSTSTVTQSTTTDSLENTTKKDPSKRTLIIALATGIPAALIIVIIIGVWIKRSAVSGLLSGISHPFTDITDQNEMTTFKLNDLQDDHTF